MQKKVFGIFLTLTAFLCVLALALSANAATSVSACQHPIASGDSTCSGCGATVIRTADELLALMNIDEAVDLTVVTASSSTDANYVAAKAALKKSYVLANDIDLSGKSNQSPIGMYDDSTTALTNVTRSLRLTGTFDGNGFTVYGVNISSSNARVGFIGAIASPAVVEDLTIAGPKNSDTPGTIQGEKLVGGIVGYAANGVTIHNCVNKCNVTTTGGDAAGILGELNTSSAGISITIDSCQNYGEIDASAYAGGIIATLTSLSSNSAFTIQDCINYGTVHADSYAGGILAAPGHR